MTDGTAQTAAQGARPVFLHGMWRSGSTYVWSKFRAAPNTRCYFEPLIEGLARLTHDRIWRDTGDVITANRHPDIGGPYFLEFEPLISGRGVRYYHRDFATRRFVLGAQDAHPALERYIASLVQHAQGQNRTAVLGFNRTSLRLPWIANRFDAYHLQVERDPREIWASYKEHLAKGDSTFLGRWLILADQNRAAPPFAAIADRLPLRRSPLERLQRPKSFYATLLPSMSNEETYLLVFTVWLAVTLQALTYCDTILDTNRAGEAGYKGACTEQARAGSGVAVDFDDMRSAPAAAAVPPELEAIEAQALTLFPKQAFASYYDAAKCRARLTDLAPRKAALISQLL